MDIKALKTKSELLVAGIDSDSKGSIALLSVPDRTLTIYYVPSYARELDSGKKRATLNRKLIAQYANALFTKPINAVYTEEQWSRPDQDVARMFTFGCIYCAIEQAMYSAAESANRDTAFELVHSKVWKNAFSLDADKDKAVALATKIFPLCTNAWKKADHVSAAEASLIAVYGYVKEMGKRGLQVDMRGLKDFTLVLATPRRVVDK